MITFISDLHLTEQAPAITARFDTFLADYGRHSEAVYILGDFFDYWIGDDLMTPYHRAIAGKIKQLSALAIPCYFMPGNRDFLIGADFAALAGLTLLPDPTVIDLYGQPVLLMHGDSLCTQDEHYLRYRKKVRDPACQAAFLAKPRWLRRAIAGFLRLRSRLYNRFADTTIMDVTPGEAERQLGKVGATRLIHGHTHRPAVHPLQINDLAGQRIVLGAWHDAGNVLICTPDQSMELITF